MIYGYARVSTKGQEKDGNSMEGQERKLKDAGAEIIFKDSFTGTKMERPELNKLMDEITEGDMLIVTKLDRIARSAALGAELIQSLLDKGVSVNILNMGMADNTPTGKLMMAIMFAFAEFERDMIVQRTQEGKAIAKQRPDYKEGRPRADQDKVDHAIYLHEVKKDSLSAAARKTGISRSTLVRALNRKKAESILNIQPNL